MSECTEHVSVFQFQDGVWTLSTNICDYLMTMDVMLCTASIFNLCAISIDRSVLTCTGRQTDYTARTPWVSLCENRIEILISVAVRLTPLNLNIKVFLQVLGATTYVKKKAEK